MEHHKVASGAASKVDKAAESTSVLALTSKVSDPVSVLNVCSNSPAENVSVISEVHEVFDSDRGVKRIGDKGERRFNALQVFDEKLESSLAAELSPSQVLASV
ncbi:hypothetical protein U1Q18_025580, partial [Sarracenia purpurea var. burkii]